MHPHPYLLLERRKLTTRLKVTCLDSANLTPATSINVTVNGPNGAVGSHTFDRNNQGSSFAVQIRNKDFHSLFVEAAAAPPENQFSRVHPCHHLYGAAELVTI